VPFSFSITPPLLFKQIPVHLRRLNTTGIIFLNIKMNTTPITLTLNLTGQLTIDPQNLEQLISGLQIPNSSSGPAIPTDNQKKLLHA
jgi:hypothetical protein